MSCATGLLGRVAGQRAGGAAEPVVERDCGGKRGEARDDPDAQVVQGAGAVAFEREDVLGGPEDRLDPLADRCQVQTTAAFVFAAGAGGFWGGGGGGCF